MPAKSDDVEQYLRDLEHPLLAEVKRLRAAILAASPDITEHIKWNAPSFCFHGEDRVTFRLQPGNRLQLVFHRGAKVKDATGFRFEDPCGLLEWAAPDRGVLTLRDAKEARARCADVVRTVQAWMAANALRAQRGAALLARRTAPGETPRKRLKARLKAASEP